MITGFNHNIKHKGRMFHVQTEDSGVANPHVITHLFMGGNILASKKASYADSLHAENLTTLVRTLMQEQQKEMLRNLIHGLYDEVVEQYAARSWQPGAVDTEPQHSKDSPDPVAASTGTHQAPPKESREPEAQPAKPPEPPDSVRQEVAEAQAMRVKPQPRDGGETIFGEDLISERSLDEVILSYLAEDGNET